MSGDAYVRLRAMGPQSFGEPDGGDAVLFVDAGVRGYGAAIREVDPALLRCAERIVVRGHPEDVKTVEKVAAVLRLQVPVDALQHPLGRPACLSGKVATPPDLPARLRRVELSALLDWGGAVWTVKDYHYRLPSGHHAGSFVKLGAAVRSPYDAKVLALWLLEDAAEDVGVVVDTGTLAPLVLALELALREREGRLSNVVVLEQYPHTQLDVNRAVMEAAQGGRVLPIISVNSSGTLRDRVHAALRTVTPEDARGKIHVLVDRGPTPPTDGVTTWLSLSEDPPQSAAACELCHGDPPQNVIPIDVGSFEGSVTSQPRLRMLSLEDARANRGFWELCDHSSATLVHVLPEKDVADRRPPRMRLGLRIDFARLLRSTEFLPLLQKRLEDAKLQDAPDLVLVPEHDLRRPGLKAILKKTEIAGTVDVRGFPPLGQPWPATLKREIARAESIRLFSLGFVTGFSLRAALITVQDMQSRAGKPSRLTGLVLHARPESSRRWSTIENVFGKKLSYLWCSYIPLRSPFDEELKLLDQATPGDIHERAFIVSRKELLAAEVSDARIFWGARGNEKITPHSIFGEKMGAATTFMAVGAAMQRMREEKPVRPPDRFVFEMPALVRSYYDPLILASALRWLRREEAWWGHEDASDAEVAIAEILKHAGSLRVVVVAELLLAFAMHKLPRSLATVLKASVTGTLRNSPEIRVALYLAELREQSVSAQQALPSAVTGATRTRRRQNRAVP